MTVYTRTQFASPLIWVSLLAVVLICIMTVLFEEPVWALYLVAALLVAVFAVFHKMTVSIDAEYLRVSYGPGLIRFRFPLGSIRSCKQVRNSWWYGLGIRWTPHGWLYNIAGLDAVELELEDGRTVRVGSPEPEVLCRQLSGARG
jgi:hypothetical protein